MFASLLHCCKYFSYCNMMVDVFGLIFFFKKLFEIIDSIFFNFYFKHWQFVKFDCFNYAIRRFYFKKLSSLNWTTSTWRRLWNEWRASPLGDSVFSSLGFFNWLEDKLAFNITWHPSVRRHYSFNIVIYC